MDALVDDVARILASPVPRSRALRLIGGALVGGCLGLRPAPAAAAPGGFQAYANAIDRRIWSYLLFQEPNPRTRKQIFRCLPAGTAPPRSLPTHRPDPPGPDGGSDRAGRERGRAAGPQRDPLPVAGA